MSKPAQQSEEHPLPPFLPKNARLIMLGSFPPPRAKWSMDFFYPNFINDMWRIFGTVFYENKDHFLLSGQKKFDKQKIVDFLNAKGIALYDAARVVRRLQGNASDKFLEIVEPADLKGILKKIPQCTAICVTGQKSLETVLTIFAAAEPKVGEFTEFEFDNRKMRLWRMPSSSRAYPLPLTEKATVYKKMLKSLFL